MATLDTIFSNSTLPGRECVSDIMALMHALSHDCRKVLHPYMCLYMCFKDSGIEETLNILWLFLHSYRHQKNHLNGYRTLPPLRLLLLSQGYTIEPCLPSLSHFPVSRPGVDKRTHLFYKHMGCCYCCWPRDHILSTSFKKCSYSIWWPRFW